MIDRVFKAASRLHAVVPGLSMSDTVKRAEDAPIVEQNSDPLGGIFRDEPSANASTKRITETVSRSGLYRVQTPQVFERGLITEAYQSISKDNAQGITDDASIAERAGYDVFVIEGDPLNLKLTHPADVELFEAVLALRTEKSAKDAAAKLLFGDDEDE